VYFPIQPEILWRMPSVDITMKQPDWEVFFIFISSSIRFFFLSLLLRDFLSKKFNINIFYFFSTHQQQSDIEWYTHTRLQHIAWCWELFCAAGFENETTKSRTITVSIEELFFSLLCFYWESERWKKHTNTITSAQHKLYKHQPVDYLNSVQTRRNNHTLL
jgi:hypothetical protein